MNIAKPKGEKQNMSFNEQHAGSKIFVRNVSEEATYEDFQVRLFIKDLDFDLQVILLFRSPFSTLRYNFKIKAFTRQNMFCRLDILHDFPISSL